MNKEYNSIPAALAADIQQLANQLAPPAQYGENSSDERPSRGNVEPAINRVLLQVAQASPELLASIILAGLGVTAIEVTESEETRQDQLVRHFDGSFEYTEVQPLVARKVIKREVRLTTGSRERASIGRQR